jgi:flagellar basal-body rod modification protein FlgD
MVNATQDTGSAASLFASLNAGSGSTAKTSTATDTQNRFLKLLVTQMKNQDPLNPMDNAQVTSQMAQLSTVSGIDKLNTTLQALADSFSAGQSLQATAMIGRNVLVPGSTLQLQDGSASGGVDLPQAADKVVISIKDSSGQVVDSVDLGAQAAGVLAFKWDGVVNNGASAGPGSYSFAVNATQGASKIDATALVLGLVGSVTQGKTGASLNVTGVGTVALSNVKQVM